MGEDQDLMQKLQDLMVSLQIKDKDMNAQSRVIEELRVNLDLKEVEFQELNSQISLKDGEITTVRNFFEKSELKNDSLEKDNETIKHQLKQSETEIQAGKLELAKL